MTWSCLLFLNKELPDHIIIEVDGEEMRYPPDFPLEKGHDGTWNRCFVNIPAGLPKHHYGFVFNTYSTSFKKDFEHIDPERYSKMLRSNRMKKEYIRKIIEICGEEPLYMRLYVDHVLSEKDLDNITEINLKDIDFTEGNEPEEFKMDFNQFYRFVFR